MATILCVGQNSQTSFSSNDTKMLSYTNTTELKLTVDNSRSIMFNSKQPTSEPKLFLKRNPQEGVNKTAVLIAGLACIIIPTLGYLSDYDKGLEEKRAYGFFIGAGVAITIVGLTIN